MSEMLEFRDALFSIVLSGAWLTFVVVLIRCMYTCNLMGNSCSCPLTAKKCHTIKALMCSLAVTQLMVTLLLLYARSIWFTSFYVTMIGISSYLVVRLVKLHKKTPVQNTIQKFVSSEPEDTCSKHHVSKGRIKAVAADNSLLTDTAKVRHTLRSFRDDIQLSCASFCEKHTNGN